MALPALASAMADDLTRRAVRMCVALQGVAWTVDVVRRTSMDTLVAAGFEEGASEDQVAIEDVAERLQVPEHVALWQLRAAGMEASAAEVRPDGVRGPLRRAAWVSGLRRRPAGERGEAAPEHPKSRSPSPASSSPSASRGEGEPAW
jgi:hypothetical protein